MNSQTVFVVASESVVPFLSSFFADGIEIAILAAFCFSTWSMFMWTYHNFQSKTRWDRFIVRSVWTIISLFVLFSGDLITNSTLVWLAIATMIYRLVKSPFLGLNYVIDPHPLYVAAPSPTSSTFSFKEPSFCQPPAICRAGSYYCPQCPKNQPPQRAGAIPGPFPPRAPSFPAYKCPSSENASENAPKTSRLRTVLMSMLCSAASYLFGIFVAKMVNQSNKSADSSDEESASIDDSSTTEEDDYPPKRRQYSQYSIVNGERVYSRCPPVRFAGPKTVPDCDDDDDNSFFQCPNMPKPYNPITRGDSSAPASISSKPAPGVWDMFMMMAPGFVEPAMSTFGAAPETIAIAKTILSNYSKTVSEPTPSPVSVSSRLASEFNALSPIDIKELQRAIIAKARENANVEPVGATGPTTAAEAASLREIDSLLSQLASISKADNVQPVGATGPTTAAEAAGVREINSLLGQLSSISKAYDNVESVLKGVQNGQTVVSNVASPAQPSATIPCAAAVNPRSGDYPTIHISDSEAESEEDFADMPALESDLFQAIPDQYRATSPLAPQ